MPGEAYATAAILSPTPIACSALTACGLALTAAPISPRAGAVSNTSGAIPKVLSAFAAASPASPPPTIAILQLPDIRSSCRSIDRYPRRLHDARPAILLLRHVRRKRFRRGRPGSGTRFRKCLLDLIAGERARHRFAQLPPARKGSAGRRDDEIDRRGDEVIEPALHHGRNDRRERAARLARDRQSPQAAVADIGQHLRQRRKEDV